MKSFLTIAISIVLLSNNIAQQNKLSPLTRIYLNKNKSLAKDALTMRALIQVDNYFNQTSLTKLGITVQTKAGNIWSITAPIYSIEKLNDLQGLQYVEASFSAMPLMQDTDWIATKTNLVHQGFNLPMAYKGDGIIVGAIDIGFDYNNPAFFDANGNCRIKRVWEQNKTGNAPAGFNYGNELTTVADYKTAKTDRPTEGHGTMVAGIAAGAGIYGKGNANRGMAPNADLVLIALNYGTETFLDDKNTAGPAFVDAIDYIFKYAASQNKPAVINISWGHHAGSHDGTSLLDKAIENLTGAGKILVNAAGNEGKQLLHLQQNLQNDTFNTISNFTRKPIAKETNTVNFWGTENTDFAIQIKVLDTLQNQVAQSVFYSASGNANASNHLYFGNDTLTYTITSSAKNVNNNKPEIFLIYENTNCNKYYVSFAFTSAKTILHAWNCGYNWSKGYPQFIANLVNQPQQTHFVMGNNQYTIGESGSNSKASIAVGSYNSNVNWTNFWGGTKSIDAISQKDTITGFSSRGPSTDNRIKPDITAPGYFVGGPISSFTPLDITDITDTVFYNGTRYDWVMSAGTSFAAPCVAGAIALMLQADRMLTPAKALTMLKNSARVDAKTGVVPTNNWGWGKINVYEAFKLAYATSIKSTEKPHVLVYPNPFTNQLNLEMAEEPLTLEITNMAGQLVYHQKNPNKTLDLSNLPLGIYVLKITLANNQVIQHKIAKIGE